MIDCVSDLRDRILVHNKINLAHIQALQYTAPQLSSWLKSSIIYSITSLTRRWHGGD